MKTKLIASLVGILVCSISIIVCDFKEDPKENKKLNSEVLNMKLIGEKTDISKIEYESTLDKALNYLTIPETYELADVSMGKQNDVDVLVFRYKKNADKDKGLGGEHYSFTCDSKNGKIMGFTWMDQQFVAGKQLPTKSRTTEIVKEFLDKMELGLFEQLENLWIEPHNEIIEIDGKKITLTGMKYKCYLKRNDTYTWVIVAPDESVMTFEQEIKWVNGRVTEKWLHDSWLGSRLINQDN